MKVNIKTVKAEVAKLDLKDDDILAIRMLEPLTQEEQKAVHANMARAMLKMGLRRCLLLPHNAEVIIIDPDGWVGKAPTIESLI